MSRPWVFSSSLLLAALPAVASAAPVVEVAHEIEVEFHADHATVVVERTLQTTEEGSLEGHVSIEDEFPLVATGLRTKGDDGRWYRGELMPVHDAVETYWALTGSAKVVPQGPRGERFPQLRPKDPALLMWEPDGLQLYVFPLSDGQPRSVQYTLEVPYAYEQGAHVLRIPAGSHGDRPPRVRFGARPAGFSARAAGVRIERGTRIDATSTGVLEVRLTRTSTPPLRVGLASTPAGERHLARVSLEASPALGPDPARTHAVVVLDVSRSMGDESLAAARTAVDGYLGALAEVPGAKVELVTFDRRVVAHHGSFVTPQVARRTLADAALALGNGSDLPAALAEARARITKAPRGAPRRVLVISDTKLAPAQEAQLEASLTAAGATVHLVDLQGDRATSLQIHEDHRMFDVVADTGGMTWRGTVDAVDHDDPEVFGRWVRPAAVRNLVVTMGTDTVGQLDLAAGEGALDVDLYEHAPRQITARGWLWGEAVEVHDHRKPGGDRRWATVAAAYPSDSMTDAELLDVATRAGAVSAVTALLALEPQATAGEAVEPPDTKARHRVTSCKLGGGFGADGGFGRYSLKFDETAHIDFEVETAIGTCRAKYSDVEVELTTTYAEVVSVDWVEVADNPQAESCLREQLWTIEFPPGRDQVTHHVVRRAADG